MAHRLGNRPGNRALLTPVRKHLSCRRLYRGQGDRRVALDSWFKESAIHGWVAVFFTLSPDGTGGRKPPQKHAHQRFVDRLAWRIASRKADIDQLPSLGHPPVTGHAWFGGRARTIRKIPKRPAASRAKS